MPVLAPSLSLSEFSRPCPIGTSTPALVFGFGIAVGGSLTLCFFNTPDCNQHLLRDLSSSTYPLVKKNSGRPCVYLYMKHCLEHNVGE